MIRLFDEPLYLKEDITAGSNVITGYDGCYFIQIDLAGEVYGRRLGLLEYDPEIDCLMFRDGEDYKDKDIEWKEIGTKYIPLNEDPQEVIEYFKNTKEEVYTEAYEEDAAKLSDNELKAFEILYKLIENEREVNHDLALLITKNGEIKILKVKKELHREIYEEELQKDTEELKDISPDELKVVPAYGIEEVEEEYYHLLWKYVKK